MTQRDDARAVKVAPAIRPAALVAAQITCLIPGAAFMWDFVLKGSANLADGRHFTLADDAMISMTYARTLARTGEWVWYPGAPRVEGFTNPLWTLYMALLHKVGFEGSSAALAVSVTGAFIVLAIAFIAGRILNWMLRRRPGRLPAVLVATAFTPFIYPLSYWTLRGMEVGALALAASALVLCVGHIAGSESSGGALRRWAVIAAITSAGGVLVRMDFLVVAIVVIALGAIGSRGPDARRLLLLWVGGTTAVTLILIVAFQWVYWGSPLPNTFDLKMSGFNVWERVSRGVVASARALPVILLAALGVALGLRRRETHSVRLLVALVSGAGVSILLYGVWVGGDAWEWLRLANRYIATALPMLGILWIAGLTMSLGYRTARLVGAGIPFAGLVVLASWGSAVQTNPFRVHVSSEVRQQALYLLIGLAVTLVLLVLARQATIGRVTGPLAVVAGGCVLVIATSYIPLRSYLDVSQAQLVAEDINRTRDGIALSTYADRDATVAVLPAGAVPYYSGLRAIDLLGKSDRYVASRPRTKVPPDSPLATFFPGHNKWDYDYSIRRAKPDIVYQPNMAFLGFESLGEWGYEPRCDANGVRSYYLSSSRHVDLTNLTRC